MATSGKKSKGAPRSKSSAYPAFTTTHFQALVLHPPVNSCLRRLSSSERHTLIL